MTKRWAFLIGIDKPLATERGIVPYAEAGTKRLHEALRSAEYASDHIVMLLGSQATKTVIESRLRMLKKAVKRGDTLIFYFAGGSVPEDQHLWAWDTQPDDVADTAIGLRELHSQLVSLKAGEIVLLLETAVGDLTGLFANSAKAVCLAASHTEPLAAAATQSGVWTHLLAEAVSGAAGNARDDTGSVTALSLHHYLEAELPRAIRKHFEPGSEQVPLLFGEQNAGIVLADHSHRNEGTKFLLDTERLQRVIFRGETTTRVKDLTAWRKTFDLPERAIPSSRSFVARVANPDVKRDLDEIFEASREQFGYKRKEVNVETGPDGYGSVRTPDFEYSVTAMLDPEDVSRVSWRREVGNFREARFVQSADFQALFRSRFDSLVFEFRVPVDVERLVDRLEDHPPKGAMLQLSPEGGTCEIRLKGFHGRVVISRHSLIVRGRSDSSSGLLDQLVAFLSHVGPLGETLMLK